MSNIAFKCVKEKTISTYNGDFESNTEWMFKLDGRVYRHRSREEGSFWKKFGTWQFDAETGRVAVLPTATDMPIHDDVWDVAYNAYLASEVLKQ